MWMRIRWRQAFQMLQRNWTSVEAVAASGGVPLVMGYWNPIEKYGPARFAADLRTAGAAGAITPDLIPEEAARKQQKWQRVALEACKQCGQNWLPRVHLPQSLESWLGAGELPEFRLMGALTADARPLEAWMKSGGEGARSAGVLVGPEGDFSPQEMEDALAAGFHPLAMGPIVLRAETAAIFGLSILTYELNAGR